MTDKPISFSAPMVRALLASRKRQTRRLLTPQPEHLQVYDWKGRRLHDSEYRHWCWRGHVGADNWDDITTQLATFLPYQVGDRLFVGEGLRRDETDHGVPYKVYTSDGSQPLANASGWDWKVKAIAGRYCPKWASRITLHVTMARIQRLWDISDADALEEGVQKFGRFYAVEADDDWDEAFLSPRDAYFHLLDSLHGDGFSAENPWVAAYSFDPEFCNIAASRRPSAEGFAYTPLGREAQQ